MELLKFLENPTSHALTLVVGMLIYHLLWGVRLLKRMDEVTQAYIDALNRVEAARGGGKEGRDGQPGAGNAGRPSR